MTKQRVAELAGAATLAAMSLFGGLAAANALPGAAQAVASDMLSKVGVSVPGPDSHAGSHPDARGQSSSHTPSVTSNTDSGQGSTISNLARTTTETGVNKGAAVSSAASDGTSQAGTHGSPSVTGTDTPSGTPPSSTPPFSTPPVSTPPTSGPPSSTPPVATPPVPTPPVNTPNQAQSGLAHQP